MYLFFNYKVLILFIFSDIINFSFCNVKDFNIIELANLNTIFPKHKVNPQIIKLDSEETDDLGDIFLKHKPNKKSKIYYKQKYNKYPPIPKIIMVNLNDDDSSENINNNTLQLNNIDDSFEITYHLTPHRGSVYYKKYYVNKNINYKKEPSARTHITKGRDAHKRTVDGNDFHYSYYVIYGDRCGGSIISDKWVITTARCGTMSFVKTGSLGTFNKINKVTVMNHFVHPMFHFYKYYYDYDFQLLELVKPLYFHPNVRPIKLGRSEDFKEGDSITVTCWKLNFGYSDVFELETKQIPLAPITKCYKHLDLPTISGITFCAGFKKRKKDICEGAAGAPAVLNNRLLGMGTKVRGGALGAYNLYANVVEVRDWIANVTELVFD